MKIDFNKIRNYKTLRLSTLEVRAIEYGISETAKGLSDWEYLKSIRFYANLYLSKKDLLSKKVDK